jgi:hypothetical protein
MWIFCGGFIDNNWGCGWRKTWLPWV